MYRFEPVCAGQAVSFFVLGCCDSVLTCFGRYCYPRVILRLISGQECPMLYRPVPLCAGEAVGTPFDSVNVAESVVGRGPPCLFLSLRIGAIGFVFDFFFCARQVRGNL